MSEQKKPVIPLWNYTHDLGYNTPDYGYHDNEGSNPITEQEFEESIAEITGE